MNKGESLVSTIRSMLGRFKSIRHAMGSAARTALVLFVSMGMVLLSPGGPAIFTAYAQSGSTGAGASMLDALFATYEALLGAIDPVEIDVEELAFELAFETPETIADWMTTNIAYHPYEGLLRGPTGTLLALGGNTLDQAVLLAKLVNDAGYDARIAWAEVPAERSVELWSRASPSPDRVPPSLAASEAFADRALLTEGQIADAQTQVQQAYDAFDAIVTRERDALDSILRDETGFAWDAGDAPEHLFESMYAWVDVRTSPDAPWKRLHPVFSEPPEWVDEVEPIDVIYESVPAELQHRLRFQVIIEQRLGDELEEKPVTEAWERPVANLVGSSFTFASMPDTLSDASKPLDDVDTAFEEATFIYPLLNDGLAPGAQLFDLEGNTAPPEAAASPAAEIFQNVGSAFGGAVGALSGEEEPVALTAQWLEFTLIEPGGEERVFRRAIFDRIGAENRAAGSTALLESVGPDAVVRALQASHSFMVDPGSYPAHFVQHETAERMLASESYLRTLFEADPSTRLSDLAPPSDLTAAIRTFDHLRQFLTFDARSAPPGTLSYRNRPALSLISKSWDGSRDMTDVIQNDRVSLVRQEGSVPRLAPSHAQAMGIWETVTEGVVLSSADEIFSVPRYMEAAREQGVPVVVADPADPATLDRISAPASSREAMRRDLQRGYFVVAPDRVPEGMPGAAWWRVHPATGVTLGRGLDGRGVSEGLEYITVSGIVVSTFFGIAGVASCVGAGGSGGCCLAEGAGWFVLGFLLGAAVGSLGGAVGLTELAAANMGFGVGAAFDFASFNMGLAGILPTSCTSSERPTDRDLRLVGSAGEERRACDATQILRAYLEREVSWHGPTL